VKALIKNKLYKKLRKNIDKIRSFSVKRIGIFGSKARGKTREDSDIDIIRDLCKIDQIKA